MAFKCGGPADSNYSGNTTGEVGMGGTRGSSDYECNRVEWAEFGTKFSVELPYPPPDKSHEVNKVSLSSGDPCKGSVVWFYPDEDHNGAFRINANVCHRLL